MSKGWVNDDRNKSVPINPNVKSDHARQVSRPAQDGFIVGRTAGVLPESGRDIATVTTNKKKGRT